jgi:hypothetical protein
MVTDDKAPSSIVSGSLPEATRFTPSRVGFCVIEMKTETLDGPSAILEVSNEETGRHYSADDCPPEIKWKILDAIEHRRFQGILFSGGLRWDWAAVKPAQETVTLQFTRNDETEFEITVSLHAWRSFSRLAQRRGVDPTGSLTELLGYGSARNLEIAEMVRWIFGGRSPCAEIQAFEAVQKRFHRTE